MDPTVTQTQSNELKRRPIAPDHRVLTSEAPTPTYRLDPAIDLRCDLISSSMKLGIAPSWATTYVGYWVKHPESGSSFERAARLFNWLPARVLLPAMQMLGYDGLICRRGEHIVGHLFFQRHGDSLHMFSISVTAELQGRGLGTILVTTFVEWSRSRSEIASVRLGAGGDQRVCAIVNRLNQNAAALGVSVDERYFVRFLQRQLQPVELTIGSTRAVCLRQSAGLS